MASVTTDTLYGGDIFLNRTARNRAEIADLVGFLEEQVREQADFVVPAKDFSMKATDDGVRAVIDLAGVGMQYHVRPIAHDQIGQIAGIPAVYYDRMLADAPDLLADNVNRWLPATGKTHLTRTTGRHLRAVLSDAYQPLDNLDAFYNAFKVGRSMGAEVIRAQLSESRFYVALVNHDWAEDVEYKGGFSTLKPGRVAPIVTVVNSEVGRGGLSVDVGLFEYVCINNNVWARSLAKVHRGRRLDVGFISPETRRLEVDLVWATVRDAVTAAFDREQFQKMVARMSAASGEIVDDPEESVQVVAREFSMSESERNALMKEFMSPTVNPVIGPSVLALTNALSFVAHEVTTDPDRQSELERAAGEVLRKGRELVAVR